MDWSNRRGWDKHMAGEPKSALAVFADLARDFQDIHDRAVEVCRLEPGCDEITHEIVDWARRRRLRAEAVQGWFDGADDWYHWWAEVRVGRRCYIVDGTRNQFYPVTTSDPVLMVIPCRSLAARDYQRQASR